LKANHRGELSSDWRPDTGAAVLPCTVGMDLRLIWVSAGV
jgi:hypothetical protein